MESSIGVLTWPQPYLGLIYKVCKRPKRCGKGEKGVQSS